MSSDEEEILRMSSDEKEKTLLCFDANNWLESFFWKNDADLEFLRDPWEGLWYSDRTVGKFVRAARSSNYELVVVASGGASSREAREKYKRRREKEIVNEKRGVCLGAPLFLQESFEKQGVRVVRPIDADVNDVLASIAEKFCGKSKGAGAVILSKNLCFFSYDRPLSVCRGFTVRGGELILEQTVTRCDDRCTRGNARTVQPHLGRIAMDKEENLWSQQGRASAYRPSLWKEARIERGTTSSSDKRMGNLHFIAWPLRAAVYASLGEHLAMETIPEWNEDKKMVEWKEIEVFADPTLDSELKDPLAVLKWLVQRDSAPRDLERWRYSERVFNTCALAAELVAASSHGAWTVLECMALFSKNAAIIERTTNPIVISSSPAGDTTVEREPARSGIILQPTSKANQDARAEHDALEQVSGTPVVWHPMEPMQHQIQTPNPLPVSPSTPVSVAQTQLTPPRTRPVHIFGNGRPREEVLAENRQKQGSGGVKIKGWLELHIDRILLAQGSGNSTSFPPKKQSLSVFRSSKVFKGASFRFD